MHTFAALRRRIEPSQLEDLPTEGEHQIIGQELVPVIPMTPSAEGGDLQNLPGGDQQLAVLPRGNGPCGHSGEALVSGGPGGDDSELPGGERAQTVMVAASPGIPNGEGRPDDQTQEGQLRVLRSEGVIGGDVLPPTPRSSPELRREGAWPGGPIATAPRSFGPVMNSPDGAPCSILHSFDGFRSSMRQRQQFTDRWLMRKWVGRSFFEKRRSYNDGLQNYK